MQTAAKLLSAGMSVAALCGCVAIPMGTTTFRTEYPGEVRAAGTAPEKAYEAQAEVADGAGGRGTADVGLSGEVTITQEQERPWSAVTLTKRKMFAIGLAPEAAETFYRPKEALCLQTQPYLGNGTYGTPTKETGDIEGGYVFGYILNVVPVGIVSTPFTFLVELFGPFEHDRHFTGPILETKYTLKGNVRNTQVIRDGRPIELLWKFPAADRKRIGAWTWKENGEHPQNTFWNGFRFQWVGVHKYCTYVVHEPEDAERRDAVSPKVTKERRVCRGPYRVFLEIPELGYAKTLEVPRGEERVRFDFSDAADGRPRAAGRLRFLPPQGGFSEMWDDDSRALLAAVQGREHPATLELPPPRLRAAGTGGGAAAGMRSDANGLYVIEGMQRSATGGLRVRVKVTDPARAEEADRQVRTEILRFFREKIASPGAIEGRERVERRAGADGSTWVYQVEPAAGE